LEKALDWKPAAVLICNPSSMHVPTALTAARAGCHLFIEKPLGTSMEGVSELIAEVENRKLVALVGFSLRFHPGVIALAETARSGAIGEVLYLRAHVGQYLPDWHPWEDYRKSGSSSKELGGGAIFDLIHELDLVRWIGGSVSSVTCTRANVSTLEIETEDLAEIVLSFESGGVGSVHVDYLDRVYTRHCRIVGSEGTVVWDETEGVRLFEAAAGRWRTIPVPSFERNDIYLDEMRHWLACLNGVDRPRVDIRDGAAVLALALAAHTAAESNRVIDVRSFSSGLRPEVKGAA
ncbi:MAG TPA: Gfo/Idh/MocA family oxidoreductase, partial [Gemmatimonadaceae bacterium]|nr:Gfo/Idh/MocA family oxidoreductase [Gemmatimonadaceae bacterium]